MNQPTEQQILEAGKIVTRASEVETRLGECGATGVGLREKCDSLGARLSPETVRLIAGIGGIRNRIAHEAGATVTAEEFAQFQAAATAVLAELDRLASPRRPAPNAAKPAEPPPPTDSGDEDDWIRTAGRIPGVHLVYAVKLAADAMRPGRLILLLALLELTGLALLGWGLRRDLHEVAGIGGSFALFAWAAGIGDGWRRRREGSRFPAYLFCIPVLNFLYFAYRLLRLLRWFTLIEAAIILTVWAAAIHLVFTGEFAAAGLLALLSYAAAVLATCINR